MTFRCFLWTDISPGPDGMKPLFLVISRIEFYKIINARQATEKERIKRWIAREQALSFFWIRREKAQMSIPNHEAKLENYNNVSNYFL